MPDKKFVVKHRLDQLSAEELAQYLRDVSTYIGLDPDLNGLDTLWMDNESGVGRSLVVYAKRGTAEILRNIYHVDVQELSHAMVKGSIVFTAAGRGGRETTRVERAVGSKNLDGLIGKALDNGIMTASTRALRRLTMQFTTLGILDESELVDFVGQSVNPAATAQLAGSPVVIPPQPQVPANNAPGVNIDPEVVKAATELTERLAASMAPHFAALEPEPPKAKKTRKSKNTVSLEVEPEVVNKEPVICVDCQKPLSAHPLVNSQRICPGVPMEVPAPAPAPPPVPTSAYVAQTLANQLKENSPLSAGLPSKEQMDEYRKKIGVFTQQLPATPGLGSVQRMRAFITKMSDGTAPQNMTVVQWEKAIAWFDDFSARNGVKGLLKFINDTLGDVPKA